MGNGWVKRNVNLEVVEEMPVLWYQLRFELPSANIIHEPNEVSDNKDLRIDVD